jgi:hypothetical protein
MKKNKKRGIDWYRYDKLILKKKFLPFAKKLLKYRKNTIVQKDKAPAHAHRSQIKIFNI